MDDSAIPPTRPTTSGTPIFVEPALSQDETLSAPVSASMLCCDPNGMCLGTRGDIDESTAGSYTSLIRLASQLSGLSTSTSSLSNSHSRTHGSLLVAVETSVSTIMVKEYGDHTVVLSAPTKLSDIKKDGGNDTDVGDPILVNHAGDPDGIFENNEQIDSTA